MYVQTLLDAVDYMHEKNCVHRDLKPENVLLADQSEAAAIKIVDLGTHAQSARAPSSMHPRKMAPWRARAHASARERRKP